MPPTAFCIRIPPRKTAIEIEVGIAFINHNMPLPSVTIEGLNQQTAFTDRQYVNNELKEMFFKLGLIQSYGSGICRAKTGMKINDSPKQVFQSES